jgi:hypothetical protein
MLFGDDEYAVRYNYTDCGTRMDTLDVVKRVFGRRKARFHEINQMFNLERDDLLLEPLQMPCSIEAELLKNLR